MEKLQMARALVVRAPLQLCKASRLEVANALKWEPSMALRVLEPPWMSSEMNLTETYLNGNDPKALAKTPGTPLPPHFLTQSSLLQHPQRRGITWDC